MKQGRVMKERHSNILVAHCLLVAIIMSLWAVDAMAADNRRRNTDRNTNASPTTSQTYDIDRSNADLLAYYLQKCAADYLYPKDILRMCQRVLDGDTGAQPSTTQKSWAYFYRANALVRLNNIDVAIEEYSRSISIAPTGDAYYGRAVANQLRGNIQQAISDYRSAVNLGKSEATARLVELDNRQNTAQSSQATTLNALDTARPQGDTQAARVISSESYRVALVIGNGAYVNVPRLANPKNDARLVADNLSQLGFELIGGGPQIDLDKAAMESLIRRFGAKLGEGTVGVFYYSGHGLQIGGENYLVPISANPTSIADVDFELIGVDLVMRQMALTDNGLNVIILDACRNNPFAGRGLRSTVGGLAQMVAPRGTLISYATQPGAVAADGAGQNSPYTSALVEEMKRPSHGVFEVFNNVAVQVDKATKHAQQPWFSSSPIEGSFYFNAPQAVGSKK